MIAAFALMKCTGTNAATETDCSKAPNFLNVDARQAAFGSYPVGVPAVGDPANYSYEVWLRLKCTSAPNNQCNNFKFWGPGQQPDAPTNKVTVLVGTTGTGSTPTDSASTVATTTQHNNYNGSGAGEYLSLGVVPADSIIDASGEYTNFLVLQLKVEAGAARGNITDLPFYVEYDES